MGKFFFWMYFQIVSTFLRNLQGFLWETPKLFLCGFGQKYLVFSYQISKRLNSWLFWRKGNTFHKKNPHFLSSTTFFHISDKQKSTKVPGSTAVVSWHFKVKIRFTVEFLPAAAPVSANILSSHFHLNARAD